MNEEQFAEYHTVLIKKASLYLYMWITLFVDTNGNEEMEKSILVPITIGHRNMNPEPCSGFKTHIRSSSISRTIYCLVCTVSIHHIWFQWKLRVITAADSKCTIKWCLQSPTHEALIKKVACESHSWREFHFRRRRSDRLIDRCMNMCANTCV